METKVVVEDTFAALVMFARRTGGFWGEEGTRRAQPLRSDVRGWGCAKPNGTPQMAQGEEVRAR